MWQSSSLSEYVRQGAFGRYHRCIPQYKSFILNILSI